MIKYKVCITIWISLTSTTVDSLFLSPVSCIVCRLTFVIYVYVYVYVRTND